MTTNKPTHTPHSIGVNIRVNRHYGVAFTTTARDGKSEEVLLSEIIEALQSGRVPFGPIRLIRRRL